MDVTDAMIPLRAPREEDKLLHTLCIKWVIAKSPWVGVGSHVPF